MEKKIYFLVTGKTAKIKARNIQTASHNIKGLISAMPELRKMTMLKPKEFCPQIKKYLADCGIALVFLPHLKGSFLQGASFMDGNKLAYIALGHVGQSNGTSEEFEAFRRGRDYSEGSVLLFAKEQGIAPRIVVGRMQLEGNLGK